MIIKIFFFIFACIFIIKLLINISFLLKVLKPLRSEENVSLMLGVELLCLLILAILYHFFPPSENHIINGSLQLIFFGMLLIVLSYVPLIVAFLLFKFNVWKRQ